MRDLRVSARLAMQDQNYDAPEAARIRNVRRRLFVDEEKSGNGDNAVNIVIEENKRHLEQAKERWNFDFVNEKPLPGNYEWKKLDKDGNEVEESEKEKREETKAEKKED